MNVCEVYLQGWAVSYQLVYLDPGWSPTTYNFLTTVAPLFRFLWS